MVVFTCNHCGDSLQKPKVEKHYMFGCRKPKSLTCVDCLKDFFGEDYNVHTKCITEDERYAAKGSIPSGTVKKGEQKQESWTEMVKSIIDKEKNMKPSHRNLLNNISGYSNIPRKRNRFINFIKSSSGGRVNMGDVEAVWDLIEKHKKCNFSQNNNKKNDPENEKIEKNSENEKKRKADKNEEENGEELSKAKKLKKNGENQTTECNSDKEKFSFKDNIIEVVKKKGSISATKLQKKVINHYLKHTGETECSDKLIKKYNKKLNKIENISIMNDVVTLIENEV